MSRQSFSCFVALAAYCCLQLCASATEIQLSLVTLLGTNIRESIYIFFLKKQSSVAKHAAVSFDANFCFFSISFFLSFPFLPYMDKFLRISHEHSYQVIGDCVQIKKEHTQDLKPEQFLGQRKSGSQGKDIRQVPPYLKGLVSLL